MLQVCRHFGVRSLVCINKCDLNPDQAERIRTMAREQGARVIGEIPVESTVNGALWAGMNLVKFGRGPAAEAIRRLWVKLRGELQSAAVRVE